MNTSIFNELLNKKMTRQEFLLHIGLLVITITGISGLLKTLSNPHLTSSQTVVDSKSAFGGGPYGG